jgi:MSHA biogenesis protein MshL
MKKIKFSTCIILSLLTACATTEPVKESSTLNKIKAEIKNASENKSKEAVPKNISDALLPDLKLSLPPTASAKLEPRFDLVINNAPANQVLMGIVSGTRYSMLVPSEVNASISVNLKDVTVFEALDAIRDLYGYEYRVDGNRIFIEPQTLQTRVFQVNYIVGQRSGESESRVTSSSVSNAGAQQGGGQTLAAGNAVSSSQLISSSIKTTSASDFWKDLTESLNAMVGNDAGKKVIVNSQSNLIMVRAMPADIRNVENFLRLMQLNIERQVILEAKILNVELNENSQSGVNWSIFGSRNSATGIVGNINTDTTLSKSGNNSLSSGNLEVVPGQSISNVATTALGGPIFAMALQGANFAALLQFLETQGDVHVLSSPRIATINNQKAVLKVGTDEFFVTNVQQNIVASAATTTNSPSVTLQPFFSGIALDVTPQIDKNDNIILHMHPSISSVSTVNKQVNLGSSGTLNLPLASSSISETDSIVRTRDGYVIAIGGLMTEATTGNSSGIPGLSKLKGIGAAFRQQGKATTKTELVILLKATVVQGQESWAQDMLASQRRLENLRSTQEIAESNKGK